MAPCILTAPLGAGGLALSRALSDTVTAGDNVSRTLVGGGGSVHWGCEWRHATGPTVAACTDNGRWPTFGYGDLAAAVDVVSPGAALTGRGNFFRIKNARQHWAILSFDNLVPAFTTHFGRAYFSSSRTTGIHNHWLALGGAGYDIHWKLGAHGLPAGDRHIIGNYFNTSGGAPTYNDLNFSVEPALGSALTLVEWAITYLSASRYRADVWLSVADSTGQVTVADVASSSTFVNEIGQSLDGRQAANATLYGWDQTPSTTPPVTEGELALRKYVLGNEGPQSSPTDAGYFDVASFGISLEGRLRDQSLGLN